MSAKCCKLRMWRRIVTLEAWILFLHKSMYDNDSNIPVVLNTSDDFILLYPASMLINECLIQCKSGNRRRLLLLKLGYFIFVSFKESCTQKLLPDKINVTRPHFSEHNCGGKCSSFWFKVRTETWWRSWNAHTSICSNPIDESSRSYNIK